MTYNILKKELKRNRAMNIILFVFVILTSTFMASSINDMLITMNAVDYFLEKAQVSDYTILELQDGMNNNTIDNWLDGQKDVSDYEKMQQIIVKSGGMIKEDGEEYKCTSFTALSVPSKNYDQVFDLKDQEVKLNPGEIALPIIEGERNKLKVGDKLTFTVGEMEKTFTIKCFVKDALWGNSFMGFKLLYINQEDYNDLYQDNDAVIMNCYAIETENISALEKDLIKQSFPITANISIDTLQITFIMDMIMAGMLICVSLVLILIAFFILRFTIIFTLQQDYKEIGIMKAIGVKNRGIRRIYLIKYVAISVIGTCVGIGLSFPFSALLLKEIRKNLCMEKSEMSIIVSIFVALGIVLLVVGFCYFCTNKLKSFTPMEAIRSGSNGERFKKKSIIKLHKQKTAPTVLYMAVNDLLINWKRYFSLVAVFVMGTILIILPLNTANTLKDDSLISLFGVARGDVYLTGNLEQYIGKNVSEGKLYTDIQELENKYNEENIKVKLYAECEYTAKVYTDSKDEAITIYTWQTKNLDIDNYDFISGTPPKLENEIAITEIGAEKLGVKIGGVVQMEIGGETKEYVITAKYQSMNNLGLGIRLAESVPTKTRNVGMVYSIVGYFDKGTDAQQAIKLMKLITPKYEPKTGEAFMATSMGSIIDRVDQLKMLLLVVILGINCLITVMMVRMFITKDLGEIAMLKSIGFNNYAIRGWQTLRISILLLISVILGIILSKPLDNIMGAATFGTMGASQIKLIIIPWEVYGLYPIILLIGTTLAAWITTSMIKKIDLTEINNLE